MMFVVRRRRNGVLLLAALGVGAACEGGEAGTTVDLVTRRDSAGVEIVESSASLWADGEGWRLASAPLVDIGALEGRAEDQLFRVTAATMLGDGRIAVANSGSFQLRFYDAAGGFLSATGGEGEGPGEFTFMSGLVRLPGDTLLVWDSRQGRLSRLSPQGELVGSLVFGPPEEGAAARYLGTVADGRHVGVVSEFPAFEELENGKVVKVDNIFWSYDAAGAPISELGRFPRGPQILNIETQGGQPTSVEILNVPFVLGDQVAVSGMGLDVAQSDEFQVTRLSADGATVRFVRYAGRPTPLTQAHRDAYVEAGDPTPEQRTARTDLLVSTDLPEFLPTAARLRIDSAGRLWIRSFGDAREPSTWVVIDEVGAWLGAVEFPARFNPLEIGEDYVLGVWFDDLDVEHLQLFELEKGG